MNKKGFTLIELLAVVTLIALISLLAIPNITKNVKEKKIEISEANQKILTAAADTYIQNNQIKYSYYQEADGSTYCIPIQKLIDDGVLQKPFKNVEGQEIDYSNQVKATYQAQYNSFNYQLVERTNCTELIQYVSRPELAEGMIPVTYDTTLNKWKKADKNSYWYNYSDKNWANAVLVRDYKGSENNSKNRYEYEDAPEGTIILDADILAHFVWIPRFKYQLFNSSDPTQINIVFESTTTPKSTGTTAGQWLTHPAFTYNNQELSGIWVAKYEASNQNDNIIIKPNQTSWTNIDYVEANKKSLEMINKDNIYGLEKVNTHLMRNSEWGAVAYLTNSTYGNNQNDSTTGNITGIYNLSENKEYVIIDNTNVNSLGYALNETTNWTTNNSYVTSSYAYLLRGNNSIFNYQNSTSSDSSATFRPTIINID